MSTDVLIWTLPVMVQLPGESKSEEDVVYANIPALAGLLTVAANDLNAPVDRFCRMQVTVAAVKSCTTPGVE